MSRKVLAFPREDVEHSLFVQERDVRDKFNGDVRIGSSGIRNFYTTTTVGGSTSNTNFRYLWGKDSENLGGQHVLVEIDDNFVGVEEATIPHNLKRVPEGALILEQYEQASVSKTIRTTAGTIGLMKFNDRWTEKEFTIQYENPHSSAGGDKFRLMLLLY